MLTKLEEMKLISQCTLGGSKRAFGQLVEAYQPRLRRFLMNLTLGDVALTDDLAQETFIKVYLNMNAFRGLSGFGTWLYRIAFNEFYSEKRRRHEEALPDDMPQQLITASCDATEAQMTVQTAMRALNETERTVVSLFYIEDQSIKKISSIMQIPEGSIKSSLHRAKEKMSKVIDYNKTTTT